MVNRNVKRLGDLRRGTLLLVCLAANLLSALAAQGHVGSPNVFFEGRAGAYPVNVIIRPAEVIPGLAEISVRVDAGAVERVTALPIKWNAGRKGAPPPDEARLVRGETNLYHAELWFMEPGAQSVEVEIHGRAGTGRVTIPVDAIARRVLGMPKGLGAMLVTLGVILAALLLSFIGAAVREGMLEPGEMAPPRRRWRARGAMALATVVLALALWGGKRWWNLEAAEYRNNRLYRPLEANAVARIENNQRVLRLEITDLIFARSPPLVPDHGKLMHVFLVREPGMDAFAHLHPIKQGRNQFEMLLPDLPAGAYRLYADVTYETGFSDTVTTAFELPANGQSPVPVSSITDPDDSWWLPSGLDTSPLERRLNADYSMFWPASESMPLKLDDQRGLPVQRARLNEPMVLRFTVRDAQGRAVEPEPYLGMRGHLALRREDGAVFTHLHPGGTASMAAMQLAVLRTEGKLPLKAAFGDDEPICQLPDASPADQQWLGGRAGTAEISFPYAFPKPGRYRLWVQVKIKGTILTGVYDVHVEG